MNTNKFQFKRCSISAASFFLVILLFLNLCLHAASGDSLKYRYPKDDPRNPDCPCHKYQLKADREFKKQLNDQEKKQAYNKINALKRNKSDVFFLRKKYKNRKQNRKQNSRKQKTVFFKRDISACPHFRLKKRLFN